MKFHKKRTILLLTLLLITAILVILYTQRKKIVGQYVPEVTHLYRADLTWKNDSLTGVLAVGIQNKSKSFIAIDSLDAMLRLDTITFLNLREKVDIRLAALSKDTLFLHVAIPIKRFIDFVGSVKNKDSVKMVYGLNIYYTTKVGDIKLPVLDSIQIPAPRKIEGEVVRFDYQKFRDKTVFANLLIYIYNPGKLNLAIKDIHYNFQTTGDISSTGAYNGEVKLMPGEETIISLPVEVKIDKPLKTLANVISDDDSYAYTVTLRGYLENKSPIFDKAEILFHKNGSFEVNNK